MALKWIEKDPYTGVTSINVSSDDDSFVTVRREQDVQPLLDRNLELRNTKATDIGIKKDLWLYCSIPVTVQYELLNKGINVFNKDHAAKVLEEINANYPHLKTTEKTHALGSKRRSSSPTQENSTPPGPFVMVR